MVDKPTKLPTDTIDETDDDPKAIRLHTLELTNSYNQLLDWLQSLAATNVGNSLAISSANNKTDVRPGDNTLQVTEAGLIINPNALQGGVLTGTILPFGGPILPNDYYWCDGSLKNRVTDVNLFDAIGETWGAGDNLTTFGLPNLRGRMVIGMGQGAGLTDRPIGEYDGAETHVLTMPQLPNDGVPVKARGRYGSDEGPGGTVGWGKDGGVTPIDYTIESEPLGSGQGHNNMSPFAVVNWIIKR